MFVNKFIIKHQRQYHSQSKPVSLIYAQNFDHELCTRAALRRQTDIYR